MSQKLEDGIYERKDGRHFLIYVESDTYRSCRINSRRPLDELGDLSRWKRIATLDGRPVVGEEVIEKIVADLCKPQVLIEYTANQILTKHLCTETREAGEGEASEAEYAAGDGGFVLATAETSESLDDLRAANEALKARVAELEAKPATITNAAAYEPQPPDMSLEEQVRHARGFANGVCRNDHHVARLLEQMARSIEGLQAAAVQPTSTLHHYRENATGDVWVFLPESNCSQRHGVKLSDGAHGWWSSEFFPAHFTPIAPPDEPIVRLPGSKVLYAEATGEPFTVWKSQRYIAALCHRTHAVGLHTEKEIEAFFTDSPPPTLTPEQEAEAQRLAEFAGKPIAEAREFLATQTETVACAR